MLSSPPKAPPLRQPSAVSSVKGESITKLMDTWGSQAPIGVRQASSTYRSSSVTEVPSKSTPSPFASNRHALPGLTKPPEAAPTSAKPVGRSPSPASRPTAMDLAQALNLVDPPAPGSATPLANQSLVEPLNQITTSTDAATVLHQTPSRRRLSGAPTLAAVVEVDTPPTSLTRAVGQSIAAANPLLANRVPESSTPQIKTFRKS